MNRDNSFKKYLLYLICSCIVVLAGVFYFKTVDKKNDTLIVIEMSEPSSTERSAEFTESIASASEKSTSGTSAKTKSTAATKAVAADLMIDINSANAEELTQLDGIGEVLANAIIDYRQSMGSFRNIEEIMNVNGIGEGIFDKIHGHIYVVDPIYDDTEQQSATAPDNDDRDPETEPAVTLEELTPIDINTAEIDILVYLPHIDEETAQKIIEFRDKSGGFKNEYELLLIDGLTRNEVNDILPYIEINN